MSLFSREPTEEAIRKRASALILDQFRERYYIGSFDGRSAHSPAEAYARELLKEAIKETKVVDAINASVGSLVVEDTVPKILKEIVSTEIEEVLKEDLITAIVAKINKVQLGEKK